MNNEGLLAEVEELLRTSPPQSAFKEQENDEALSWLGRTATVIKKWNHIESLAVGRHISALQDAPNEYLANLPAEMRNRMIVAKGILRWHWPCISWNQDFVIRGSTRSSDEDTWAAYRCDPRGDAI